MHRRTLQVFPQSAVTVRPKKESAMGKLIVAAARVLPVCTLVWVLVPSAPVFGQSQEQWQKFMEDIAGQVSGVMPPPGIEDVASSLRNTPDIIKSNLQQWLQSKMQDTALAGDMDRVNRYYAFYHCLAANDCSLVQRLQSKALDVFGIYSHEFKIILTAIFIFIGSTAFYTSTLICGHNIYRDLSNNMAIFLTSSIGFLLFIFSSISFIVLFPNLFIPWKSNVNDVISEVHLLVFKHALKPFVFSSIGIGMIVGSSTLIRMRYALLRWFREIMRLHYLIYVYEFTWDRFLSGIKRHGKIKLLLKNKNNYQDIRNLGKTLEGELIRFSGKAEPKEIAIKRYSKEEDEEDILINDFNDVQGIIVPHASFNRHYVSDHGVNPLKINGLIS
jgi:hypothetical protein